MNEVKSEKLAPADNFTVTDPRESVKVLKSANEIFPRELITIPELFNKTVVEHGDRIALMHKVEGSSEWNPITYADYKRRVDQIAKAFIKLGLEEHDSVAVLANNSVEWFLSFLAAIHAGGQIAGIYTTNSSDAACYILDSCRAKIVVVDTDEQLNKILRVKDKLPHLKAIIKALPPHSIEGVWKWSDLEEMNTAEVDAEYQRRASLIKPNSCCCLVFTSGTTGNPKGAMMSHDNVIWNTQNMVDVLGPFHMGQQSIVSYLPLSHIAAPFVDIFLSVMVAATVYIADKNALKGTLIKTLVEVKPTFFFGVPRVFEKIQEKLAETLSESKGFKGSLVQWAQSAALNYHKDRVSGKNPFPLQYMIAKFLILNKIKAALGFSRISYLITGSAPTSVETIEFFMSLDMPLLEAYGMTEGTGVMFSNSPQEIKIGSVGRAMAGIEAKIDNPNEKGFGEICTRGRNTFMGYINDPVRTREAIDADGWIHSGDVGYLDSDGFLHMTGRIKELIITAGGENIPFLHIENLVKAECHAISNTFLVGDKRKYLTMLITLKTHVNSDGVPCDELAPESLKLMEELGLKYKLLSEILSAGPDEKVIAALQSALDRANKNAISNAQKVQKFAILPNDFSLATGEINPTMKLKRNFLLIKYKDLIDSMYA